MGKGKLMALQLIMKSDNNAFRDAFSNLGHCGVITRADFADIEKFTCALYGLPKLSKIIDTRFVLFQQNYAPKKLGDSLGKIQGSLPPCHSVLLKKLHRPNYVTAMWKNAILAQPCTQWVEDHGWSLINGTYNINWFDGDQLPKSVIFILNGKDLNTDLNAEGQSSSDE